ncbi:class I SAM-dependent methyltransferase [Chloroflexia bacterium SDU3-3]|nr:class I SAM-dependent methyltransferase [Chloroflexia bacterium SDU3-3]
MSEDYEDESVRHAYQRYGVEGFYRTQGDTYRNPHEAALRRAIAAVARAHRLDLGHVLDLACGSGEATLALRELGAAQVDGADPYTARAYQERTGQPAEPLSFEDVAAGAMAGRRYTLIVCSFAMHLVAPSWLPLLCYWLAQASPHLLVLTPHKRPQLRPEWGWDLQDEIVVERVRARLYAAHAGAEGAL